MFIVTRAVALSAEEAVLEGVVVGDVGPGPGLELDKFVGGVWSGAE